MFGWALIRKRRLRHIPIAREDGAVACMLLVLMLFLLKDLLHDDLVIVDVGDPMSFCRFAVA